MRVNPILAKTGRALPVIALMTAATNIVSIAGGLAVLGEPLGAGPGLVALHLAAFALVIVAGWLLAPTQAALTAPEDGDPGTGRGIADRRSAVRPPVGRDGWTSRVSHG